MPELNYAIVCEYAKAIGDKIFIQAGGIDRMRLPTFPALIPLSFAFEVRFTQNECKRPHRFEMIIQGEDGDRLVNLTATALPKFPKGVPPTWKVRQPLTLTAPVPFPRPGTYSIHIMINDEEVKDMRLLIEQGPPDLPR